ncbi:phage tail tape measure protein [Streptomyces sp. NBC_01500]|uniref:phage tail tape measure protein n=1 Tax=Streptomyces sp. NBC_01500 TaxID=2903886 RepID=UPI0022577B3A|nr:phage tail tape measure protein [Streptomyces sp. NBC_01500]MCX4547278.1 transglycosylase SLT domain-containing protein [Streptomyces sp. NBC_01500]MCX4554198.1 transglycosylase SLT domain-containing protein [Streptomyces sp. NBC_01500]MCX4554538.1 transglycosylase SLT domain-containing protein [Streptomyces sp. NBC_01500]
MANAPEIAVAYVSIVPEIQGFTRQLRQQIVGPAGDAGSNAGDAAGSGFGEKFKAGAAAAAVAAAAVIAKGLADAIEQSNITKKLQAQLGATSGDAKRYGDVAGKLYSKGITENFEQGAEAIRSVVNGGLVKPDATNAQLQSIATKMSDVATTFGTDMGTQTQAVSALMKNGLAKNAGDALDVITVGMQKLGPNADDLLDTFQEYPRQLQKLGLDAKTSMGLFSQGLQGGARDTDIIADSLKEFSIRSIDMSSTSRDAYKSLGLNAKEMEQKIAKGGKGAQEGLQQVLDKLRAMKDPVKRNAAAVGLFGTQAEDLGDALFKMDPSKAVDAIGKTGGAAKKMGDTLRSGPMQQLKVFQRTLQQGLVNVLAKYVVPQFINAAKYGKAAFAWAKDNQAWLLPFAAGVGAIATAVGIYVGTVKLISVVTRVWAAAQAALNFVLNMNPIGLIILALVGLAAAIYVAWTRSETFRSIVMACWAGIQTAALYAWNNVLKPVFNSFGVVVRWLYGTIIKPVFGLIAIAFKVWWFTTRTIFAVVTTIFKALGATALWLYNNAIKPAFNWIADKVKWVYHSIIKPQFDAVRAVLRVVGDAFKSLYNSSIKPVANWIADKVKWVYRNGVKPSFDAIKTAVGQVGRAFESAKKAIGASWGQLEGIARKPISFIINSVFNRGIVGVWNRVAKAFGAPSLAEFHPKGFAAGGILPGYTPGRDVHLAALSGGEAVMRPEWARAMGSGYVNRMNALARKGGVGAIQKAMGGGLPAFKDGGIFDWISSAGSALKGAGSDVWNSVKKGAFWLKDGLESSVRAGINKVVNPILPNLPGGGSGWGKAAKHIPAKMVDVLAGYAKKADAKGAGGNVGNPPGSGVNRWRATVVKALSANGLSTSGSMVARVLRQIATESGGNQNAVQGNIGDVNNRTGDLAKGLMQTISATFNAYKFPGHGSIFNGYDNLLAALNYAKHRYGPSLSFLGNGHGYDNGGWLQPGAGMTVNATGKPEPVFTNGQWSLIESLAARGASGVVGGGLQPGDRLILSTGTGADFEVYVDQRADARIRAGLTGPASLGRSL